MRSFDQTIIAVTSIDVILKNKNKKGIRKGRMLIIKRKDFIYSNFGSRHMITLMSIYSVYNITAVRVRTTAIDTDRNFRRETRKKKRSKKNLFI